MNKTRATKHRREKGGPQRVSSQANTLHSKSLGTDYTQSSSWWTIDCLIACKMFAERVVVLSGKLRARRRQIGLIAALSTTPSRQESRHHIHAKHVQHVSMEIRRPEEQPHHDLVPVCTTQAHPTYCWFHLERDSIRCASINSTK